MSCYFRHLKDILDEAGIEVTARNSEQIDRAIHNIVEVHHKDCPAAWRKLKREILGDKHKRQDFVNKLQNAIR